jgi:hypothetical protein
MTLLIFKAYRDNYYKYAQGVANVVDTTNAKQAFETDWMPTVEGRRLFAESVKKTMDTDGID